MDITVSARHIEISPALRAAVDEKIGRLSRFGGVIDRAEVHFFAERNMRIPEKEGCEVMLVGGGDVLRCKVTAADSFTAVDLAIAKLEPQLSKLKARAAMRQQARRRAALRQADASTTAAAS